MGRTVRTTTDILLAGYLFKVRGFLLRLFPTRQNLAVLGGNDPHSYGVTSRRASMNTLRPNFYSQAPRDADLSTKVLPLTSEWQLCQDLSLAQLGPNSDSVPSRYLYRCLTIKTKWWSVIESNYLATTPLDNAYRVTAGNGEHTPKTLDY